jgi:hypothetical protein
MTVTRSGVGPLDLRLRVTHRFRPVEMVAPGFVEFDTDRPEGGDLVRTGVGPRAPFGAVEVHPSGTGEAAVTAGWATVDGDAVFAEYDAARRTVAVKQVTDGRAVTLAGAPVPPGAAPDRFAATLTGRKVTAAVTGGDGAWMPLATALVESPDLRRPEVLSRYSYAYGGGDGALTRVRAGYFGQVGLRDPHLVTHADGRPYVRDGRYLFTFGNAGMGFSQEAHWSVWALDPERPERMEQVAKLFFAHDGIVTGDNAGQIVWDGDRERFVILVCGGDLPTPGVYVRHATTTADILAGVHVIANERLPAPVHLSSWEPAIARIDGRWHIAYADVVELDPELAFHPVLLMAREGGDYDEGLTVRAADPAVRRTEGCVLQRFDTGWHLLATDDADRRYRVYDMDLREIGTLDAPFLEGGPHPSVFPVPGDGRDWMMLTFANVQFHEKVLGYGTEGDVVVLRGHAVDG